ncbi:MAG: hypothetical protein P8P66_13675 [Paracoccaceae bacterium]|nr:hypothetical protein [Paracoccaceae bacterium]
MAKSWKPRSKTNIKSAVADAVDAVDNQSAIDASAEDAVEVVEDVQSKISSEAVEEALQSDEVVVEDFNDGGAAEDLFEPGLATSAASQEPRRGGFLPLILGGAVAAGFGVAASEYFGPFFGSGNAPLVAQIEQQNADLAALRDQISAINIPDAAPDLSADLAALADQNTEISSQLTAIDTRLIEVEKQPAADGSLTETAFAAYDREIADLRAMIETQTGEMQTVLDQASSVQEDVIASANDATARAALARVQAAIDVGEPFDSALADLTSVIEVSIPDALNSVAGDGVPTMKSIQDGFPDAARAALASVRSETPESGISGFLKSQFGARSTKPREGDDPDAVLSRVQGAVDEGRLTDALAEIETLPEVGRAELTEWIASVTARTDALNAVGELAGSLGSN